MNTDTRLIPLTQGKFAIVDAVDYEWLMQWKWFACRGHSPLLGHFWYARRNIPDATKRTRQSSTSMHRALAVRIGLPISPKYDHRDHNGLNNCRSNIRPCTDSQNGANQRKQPGRTSRYKGVYWHKSNSKWRARIVFKKKQIALGYFDSEELAYSAYRKAAKALFGEFAYTP